MKAFKFHYRNPVVASNTDSCLVEADTIAEAIEVFTRVVGEFYITDIFTISERVVRDE